LLFNIAVNNHNGAISLVIQSIIIYGGPMSPLYMTCPTFIGIRVFWNKDDRFLQHKGDETLRPMIDQFVVDLYSRSIRYLLPRRHSGTSRIFYLIKGADVYIQEALKLVITLEHLNFAGLSV
jgi:hypothetical protein